ncbi:FecCD family ABC transporter permease [Candidatus Pseudomonas adelgestsugas]|uniref:Fe(3+) dicitrate transport system permease protein FecD n=1 Tax=Candidatus Pseudomonas adelgestsugas TaxID=1302376 RepID=A0ABX5R9G9_9PSED|nr:iron chelate uptake ABC transporter family permease subunit [Candidatus Pseudomonas adelgestsugas]QAX81943.1 Fe(3+) dicitrate transport system permease protein FecD [Candidatus Pseudomonas adelgestsugas]
MTKPRWCLGLLLSLLLLALFVSLSAGTVWLKSATVLDRLLAHDALDFEVWNHRLPRSLIAILAGYAFGMAGAIVQGVIRNPLASPEILGVTQGASLALTIAIITWPQMPIVWLPLVACLGGISVALLLALYNIGVSFSGIRLALSGVAIAVILSSVTEFLILSHPLDINVALLALTGSLWSHNWHHVALVLPFLLLIPLGLCLAKPLNLIALSDEAAHSLGTTLSWTRSWAMVCAVVLTSVGVGVIGPIGFISLVAPHIARQLVGGHHQYLMPAAMLIGALLLVLADTLGRTLIAPSEIPAGIFTVVIGAPYFLWLLARFKG